MRCGLAQQTRSASRAAGRRAGIGCILPERAVGRQPRMYRSLAALLRGSRQMTNPVHDLSKLRIDRDAPPQVKRAFRSAVVLAAVGAAVLVLVLVFFGVRRGAGVPVQVAVATGESGSGAGGAGGAAVTANGYVVARTRASVSAKVAGRLEWLGVSEGSRIEKGEVIARLENADYVAQVTQAEAALATARAQLAEAEADRDQAIRDAQRVREIRSQNRELISDRDLDAAESRATQSA